MKVHIGEIIERVYLEKGIKMSVFAKKVGTVERNMYTIFSKQDINTGLLRKISDALDHNFFKYYLEESKENKVLEEIVPYNNRKRKKPKITIQIEIEDEEKEKKILNILDSGKSLGSLFT